MAEAGAPPRELPSLKGCRPGLARQHFGDVAVDGFREGVLPGKLVAKIAALANLGCDLLCPALGVSEAGESGGNGPGAVETNSGPINSRTVAADAALE